MRWRCHSHQTPLALFRGPGAWAPFHLLWTVFHSQPKNKTCFRSPSSARVTMLALMQYITLWTMGRSERILKYLRLPLSPVLSHPNLTLNQVLDYYCGQLHLSTRFLPTNSQIAIRWFLSPSIFYLFRILSCLFYYKSVIIGDKFPRRNSDMIETLGDNMLLAPTSIIYMATGLPKREML